MKLTKRLSSCLKYTEGYTKLADIGTDHAALPIAAVLEGHVLSALAIDNKIGPFGIAYNNVKNSKVADKIKVVLGDGLEKIDDDVDVVVISGVGGILISKILQNHSTRNVRRFILQPNNDSDMIRSILPQINYKITDELIVNEGNKLYDLIVIEPGFEQYNELQITFGPINLINKSYLFIQRINKEIERLDNLLAEKLDDEKQREVMHRLTLLKEALL